MWSVWPKSQVTVEYVAGTQQWWQFSANLPPCPGAQGGIDELIDSIGKLPKRAKLSIWVTGALLPAVVVDPPGDITRNEWTSWLQYMATQAFGAGAANSGPWVLWCSAARPAKCRVLGMRKDLWDRFHAACANHSLHRIAPLWALLYETAGASLVTEKGVHLHDGDCFHAMRVNPVAQHLEHVMRICDWQTSERLHRRQMIAEVDSIGLWRWEAGPGLVAPASGWKRVEAR